jgi:hypothetical protein
VIINVWPIHTFSYHTRCKYWCIVIIYIFFLWQNVLYVDTWFNFKFFYLVKNITIRFVIITWCIVRCFKFTHTLGFFFLLYSSPLIFGSLLSFCDKLCDCVCLVLIILSSWAQLCFALVLDTQIWLTAFCFELNFSICWLVEKRGYDFIKQN